MSDNSRTIRIEAENYQEFYDLTLGNKGNVYRSDDVDLWKIGGISNNFRVGAIQSGEWLNYELDVPDDGTYKIVSRVGTKQKQDRKFSVSFDGEEFTTKRLM